MRRLDGLRSPAWPSTKRSRGHPQERGKLAIQRAESKENCGPALGAAAREFGGGGNGRRRGIIGPAGDHVTALIQKREDGGVCRVVAARQITGGGMNFCGGEHEMVRATVIVAEAGAQGFCVEIVIRADGFTPTKSL